MRSILYMLRKHLFLYILVILTQTAPVTSSRAAKTCAYGDNCEQCTCDINQCLICVSKVCVCFDGMDYDTKNHSCVLQIHSAIKALPEQCPVGPAKVLGDHCDSIADQKCPQCEKSLECDRGICSCKNGSIYNRARNGCYVLAGENCGQNSNCSANSQCVEGVCKCNKNFKLERQMCLLDYNVTCHQKYQCHRGSHLECVNSVTYVSTKRRTTRRDSWRCRCIAEGELYIWSKRVGECVGLFGTGCNPERDSCSTNSNCNRNSSRCECAEGFVHKNKRCLRKCLKGDNGTCGQFQFCNKTLCVCETNEMIYDDYGECRMPAGKKCGPEYNNYMCESEYECSETCGECLPPNSPPCTSSCGNFSLTDLKIFLIFIYTLNINK